jgi:L-aminopeptidase/D-esterase-like protein
MTHVYSGSSLIPGLRIGHAHSPTAATGCTVFLTMNGAVAGVAVRGGAPGTRETDLLRPENHVDRVHAILLTGGSALGLAAADGVVRWLREHGYGWPTSAGPVPIVPAAVLFDLQGMEPVWPDAALGYAACEAARATWPGEGRVGAGSGATAGKILGFEHASPGGIGGASLQLPNGVTVGACVVVNAVGHVIDPADGQILAGPHLPDGTFGDTVEIMLGGATTAQRDLPAQDVTNTTIGVIWTDARLDKAGCGRLASVAHDGLARTIRPVHTPYDGDTLFALSLPADDAPPGDLALLGVAATEVVAAAVVRAVTVARLKG